MTTVDTALIGHVGSDSLAALALSDLWTMCSGVFLQGRVLSIICGQAIGANNPELAAIYLNVSLSVIGFVSILVLIAWLSTGAFWRAFGESDELSDKAGYFASVLAISIPAQVVFSQISQFLFAQRINKPQVISSLFALFYNLVFGLIFVLGIPIPGFSGYGFIACPIVTTTVEYANVMCLIYLFYNNYQSLWHGWVWKEITKERVKEFSKLYIPAAFSVASDFWRMAAIGIMAAKIGVLEVAVFNTSYRIMWITLTVIGSISGASGIKMGLRLGSGDHNYAKQAGNLCVQVCLVLVIAIALALTIDIRVFGRIFSADEEFLDLLDECKLPFVLTLGLMNFAVAIESIPVSMGRTSAVFWIGVFGSWFGQVPGVYFLTTRWRNDLYGLYSGMAIGYLLLAVLYSILVYTSDWKKYSDIAMVRAEVTEKNQKSHLIKKSSDIIA